MKYQLCLSTSSAENKVIISAWCYRLVWGWSTTKGMPPASLSNHRGPNLLTEADHSCCQGSFQSHLSHFFLLSSGANPHPVPTLKGDCSRLVGRLGERWWAAYLWEGLALLKWNSLVLSDRAMEEGRGWEDRGEGLCCVRPSPSGSEAPLLYVLHFHLSLPLHIFSPLTSGPLSHHHSSPEQADLSAVRQEICPEALRWAAKDREGNKRPPKTHHERPGQQ